MTNDERVKIASKIYDEVHGEVVLLGFRSKVPINVGWPKLRVSKDELIRHVENNYNFGIKCGTYSGLDVLDIDAPDLYPEMVQRLKDLTTYTITGRGGFHFWFKHHERVDVNLIGVEPKIDIRSTNAQVVAPGCIHRDTGNIYELHGSLTDAAAWPADLLDRYFPLKPDLPVKKKGIHEIRCGENIGRYLSAAFTKASENVRDSQEGTRNHTLNVESYGLGGLAHLGLERSEVEGVLVQAAMEAGLSEREAQSTFNSGWGKGTEMPRAIECKQTRSSDVTLDWDSTIGHPEEIAKRHGSSGPVVASSQGDNQTENTSPPIQAESPEDKRYCTSDGEVFTLDEKHCVHTNNTHFDVFQGTRAVLAYNEQAMLAAAEGDWRCEPAPLFNHGGVMVHLSSDRRKLRPTSRPLYDTVLDGKAAKWYSIADKKAQDEAPPDQLAVKKTVPRTYVSQGSISKLLESSKGLPNLSKIVTSPVFLPNGTLTTRPGYYANPGIWYAPPQDFKQLPLSSPEEALRLLLDDFLADFPFAEKADRANLLAMVLLMFLRDMIAGTSPLFFVGAPTPGTGKSLLVECCAIIATGGQVAPCAFGNDDEELRKHLTARLLEGPQVVVFDNLPTKKVVDRPSLAAVLTTTTWSDRILGRSETVTLPTSCVWIATGNNISWSEELARRIVRIRMVPTEEMPWQRSGFKHPNLRKWVMENRSFLAAGCISIIHAWLQAGRPLSDVRFGSFDEFAATMGGILTFAGVEGFLANAKDFMEQANPDAANWGRAYAIWAENIGTGWRTAKELLGILENKSPDLLDEMLYTVSPKSLGSKLSAKTDRVHGNYRLMSRVSSGNRQYSLQEITRADSKAPDLEDSSGDLDTEDLF